MNSKVARKLMILGLVFTLVFMFVACNNNNNNNVADLVMITACGGANDNDTSVNSNQGKDEITTIAGDPKQGEIVYTNNYLPCHGKGGENGHNGPNLVTSELTMNPDLVYDRVMNGLGGMPAFKDTLTDVQIKDVVAYVQQISSD